jgi:photosystem II stability/assembly factor-like uncharacterized protein
MRFPDLSSWRVTGAWRVTGVAAIGVACAALLLPVASLAATAGPAAAAATADGGALAGSPAGPAGFQPAAASFVSPARGVALGSLGCTPGQACRARLAATADGGARWHLLTAPRAWLGNRSPQVSQVLFASRHDGWLYDQYGQGLWATHDGGARWRKLSLDGTIDAMAASAATAYAVISPPGSTGAELFRSPAGRNAWARVGTMTGDPQASLAVYGRAAWFGTTTSQGTAAGTLWATTDGVHWHKYAFSCPGAYYGLSGIAAASHSHVMFLCTNALGTFHTEKEVLRSVNGGRTEHLTGQAPVGGDTNGEIAVPQHRSKVITIAAISPGPDFLYRSADGGKTWAPLEVPGTSGGVNMSSLSYVSRTVGWVVVGGPGEGSQSQLLRTSNAGRSWHQVSF